MRALVIGHFSTVGDIEVLEEVEQLLSAQKTPFDVAPYYKGLRRGNDSWLILNDVIPEKYTHLIVVCGPFWRQNFIKHRFDLDRFAHCTRIGVNLSMIEDLAAYNPFDVLIGRDNSLETRPDLSFLNQADKRGVAALCYVTQQNEYGDRQRLGEAVEMLRALAERNNLAVLELDTEWPRFRNGNRFASPSDFESVCARVDVMLTTRLHGTVLALKSGVPAIALDAIVGGGKVSKQCAAIGWSECYAADTVTAAELDAALARCLRPEARAQAAEVVRAAQESLTGFASAFEAGLQAAPGGRPTMTGPAHWPTPMERLKRQISKRLAKISKRVGAPLR